MVVFEIVAVGGKIIVHRRSVVAEQSGTEQMFVEM
jgi:hypothetical protein